MALGVSDELLVVFVPTIAYWIYAGMYTLFGDHLENYRLHPKEDENRKNLASKSTVLMGVLRQQGLQITVSLLLFMFIFEPNKMEEQPSALKMAGQLFTAAVVLDTHQYFMHRFMHSNKYLSKIHSSHHALIVPYAYGAIYSHPLESLLLEIGGSVLATLISGMNARTSMVFFTFGNIKAVDDHCGLFLPWNLLQLIFKNNSAYHDIHHQLYGNKYNLSAPFFVTWDKIMGTYMPYSLEKRDGGGYQVRPLKNE